MTLFLRVMHSASHLVWSHFISLWLLLLIIIVACSMLVADRRGYTARRLRLWKYLIPCAAVRLRANLWECISGIALVAFVIGYVAVIIYKEDFGYYDENMLTESTVRGVSFPLPIWPSLGRFFPLGEQEFNLLRWVTRSPVGYHALAVAQLLIVVVALWVVLHKYIPAVRVSILIAVLLAPSFVVPFTGLTYPERNVLFWETILLLCLAGYSRTRGRVYCVGSLVAVQFALYYKETVVLLVASCAITQIILRSYTEGRRVYRSWRVFARENGLPLGMLAVSAIYSMLFLAAMAPHHNFSYTKSLQMNVGFVMERYLQTDWPAFVLIVIILARIIRYLLFKGQLDPLWDSLAVGAVICFSGLVAMRLYSCYYTAPADLIAILYLGWIGHSWVSKRSGLRSVAVVAIYVCIVVNNAGYSAFRVIERKSIIASKIEFAQFLMNYKPLASDGAIRLFFPYSTGNRLMEMSAYLDYKGFHLIGGSEAGGNGMPLVVVEGREQFLNNLCVDYRTYGCFHAELPQDGALTVFMVDDDVATQDVENTSKDLVPLFSADECKLCTRNRSWLRLFHAVSPGFADRPLPSHWMHLDVFKTI
jgi:hypothetical protein